MASVLSTSVERWVWGDPKASRGLWKGRGLLVGAIDDFSWFLTPNCIYIDYGDFEHARWKVGWGRGLLRLPETKTLEEGACRQAKVPRGTGVPQTLLHYL